MLIKKSQQERQTQFGQLVEGLGGKYFYYAHDVAGVFTYVSESVRKILGYDPEDFQKHFETFLPDTLLNQAAVAHTEGSIRGEQQSIYEIDVLHKDGSVRRIEVFERPIFDDEGRVVGVEGMSCDITDRIAEGEKFAALLNAAPDAMIISDDQGKITLVNTRTEEMFGYSRNELIGQAVEILIPENVRDHHPRLRTDFVSNPTVRPMGLGNDLIAQHKNGSTFSVEISLSPLQTEGGVLISAAVRDITERKKAEQALRDGEEYKSAILEASLDCLVSMDHEGNIIEFNPAAEKVFGYKRDEVVGKNLSETLVPPAHREAHEKGLKHYLQTGEGPVLNQRIEITAMRAHGEEFPVELAIVPIAHGETSAFTAFIRDITERKQAEAALAQSENRLNLAMETSGVGLWDFNIQTGDTYMSPQYFSMLDYEPDELPHGYDTWQKLLHPDDLERATEQFDNFITSKKDEIFEDETRMRTKTGEDRWILARGGVVERDEQNNPVRMIGTHVDITERKRSQEILANRNQELMVARDEAEKAAREADAANQAKSVFLANMSHEIRTPMNAILGFSEILSSTVSDSQQKEYINSIRASGKSLLTLMNDILDLSKVEAGKFEIESGPVAVEKVFLDMKQVFGEKMAEKQLDFEVVLDSNLPNVLVLDESRLRQVLSNVIGNAVKFTDQGHVKLRVQCECKEAERVDLTIDIEDTGIGIPPDQQETIFGAFSQRAGQSINEYGGTGLGLAITKRLVEMMNGQIAVSSQVGVGSIFRIRLNDIQIASLGAAVLQDEVMVDVESISFDPATVLIADDIATNRDLMKGFMQKYPFQILEAENGQQAIDVIRQHRPGVTLMDIKMPVLDGYTATNMIRRDADLKDLVVVALTESVMRETEAEINLICDGFIENPVSKEALIAELVKHLPHQIINEEDDATVSSLPDATEMTDEALEKLPMLIERLKEHCETSEHLAHTQTINEVEDFAQQMQILGQEYAYSPLIQWGEQLMLQATTFDLDNMGKTLDHYGKLIEEAEGYLSSGASGDNENDIHAGDLKTLLEHLNLKIETCENLRETLTINDVEDFAERMHVLGQDHRYEPLVDWSTKLIEQASLFDMDNMAKTLDQYSELIKKLKELLS